MLVAIRADASTRIGTGHVVRCAALAHALSRAGARVVFLGASMPGQMLDWLRNEGFQTIALPAPPSHVDAAPWRIDEEADAAHTRTALDTLPEFPSWLVIDHYGIDARWERNLRKAGIQLLAIDDLADRAHDVDTLVDSNIQDRTARYRGLVPERCTTLLGPRFSLLRPEFSRLRNTRPSRTVHGETRNLGRLLACMGGTDPKNILDTVLDAWEMLPPPRPELELAVGVGSPNVLSLRKRCARLPGVTLHVQTREMATLMLQADLLVGSAGTISWERCSVGLPAVMGTTAANQETNLTQLARARTGIALGDWTSVSPMRLSQLLQRLIKQPKLIARMSKRCKALVDGRGADRVAVHMMAALATLRPAMASDATVAWAWRNAESTRQHFHNSRELQLDEHLAWWSHTLADPDRELLIAEVGSLPVGVLRLDHVSGASTVSIYLDPTLVGLGLGSHILRAAQRRTASKWPGRALRAEIHPDNAASIASFQSVGFVRRGENWVWEQA